MRPPRPDLSEIKYSQKVSLIPPHWGGDPGGVVNPRGVTEETDGSQRFPPDSGCRSGYPSAATARKKKTKKESFSPERGERKKNRGRFVDRAPGEGPPPGEGLAPCVVRPPSAVQEIPRGRGAMVMAHRPGRPGAGNGRPGGGAGRPAGPRDQVPPGQSRWSACGPSPGVGPGRRVLLAPPGRGSTPSASPGPAPLVLRRARRPRGARAWVGVGAPLRVAPGCNTNFFYSCDP